MSMLAVTPLLLTTVLSILTTSITTANATDRPYWTEQTSFTHGDTLYAVGVASNAASSEAGRKAAFDHGLEEIKNFGQVDNLDGLFIETQRTFEEPQANGSRVSVWRLLRVSIDGLRATANYQRMINATKPATTQVRTITITITPQQDTPLSGAKAPPTTTDRPRVPTVSKPVAIARPAVVTTQQQQQQEQQTILPTIPLRYPKVITGWVRDHGRVVPNWRERPDWQGQIILPSYSIY